MSLFGDGIFGKGSWYNPAGFLGKAGDLKAYAGTKEGSLMSGRAILQGGPKEQNMESARTFDVFGSPATAGTKMQTGARAGALAYGAAAALGAMGAGSLLGGGGSSGVGWGGTTSASSAPSSVAGSSNPFVTNMGYAGNSVGSGVSGTSAGTSSGWERYARMGSQMMNQGQGQQAGTQPGALQHQFVGQPMMNPYLQGYPWG